MLTLSNILQKHFSSIADLYPLITPGQNLSPSESRSEYERDLIEEISQARTELRQHIVDIGRPRHVRIAIGDPGLPPKKESSFSVRLENKKGGNRWSERDTHRSRLSVS